MALKPRAGFNPRVRGNSLADMRSSGLSAPTSTVRIVTGKPLHGLYRHAVGLVLLFFVRQ